MKMFTFLKHLFIPHQGNDYKPHFFRELSVIIILVISIFLLGFSAGSSFFIHKTVLGASVVSSVLIDLTNENRLAYNEPILNRNEKLDSAATLKAEDMANLGYFAHNSPTGITPWYWFNRVGYRFLYAGENLAINFTQSSDVDRAWLDSPTHRANLLNINFKEIGVATINGTYGGDNTIFVVQMFGTPVSAQVKDIATVSTSTSIVLATSTINKSGTSTKELALAGTSEVKGTSTASVSPIEPIITTNEFAVVKDTSNENYLVTKKVEPKTYSTWYDKLLFWGTRYVDFAYKLLVVFIACALFIMFVVEIRRQHWKHISYGLLLIIIILLFIFINKAYF